MQSQNRASYVLMNHILQTNMNRTTFLQLLFRVVCQVFVLHSFFQLIKKTYNHKILYYIANTT